MPANPGVSGISNVFWDSILTGAARPGGSPASLKKLEGFDPTEALQTYGAAAYGDFEEGL